MVSILMLFAAIGAMALSGLPAYAFSPRSATGQRITATLMLVGGALGMCSVALVFGTGHLEMIIPWGLPAGSFSIAVDPLSAVFLSLIFLVPALGSVYGLGYWKQREHPDNGRRLGLSLGALAASMAMVAIARDCVLFMIAWETMALSAYFAATAESDQPSVREAGWIYLIATHIGTMFLLAMFAYWTSANGSSALSPNHEIPRAAASAIFALALLGFGFKAGLMPLHVWLPGAHSNAPSHVSAVMSGVMLKMGIYGIIRMVSLFPAPPSWWGGLLIAAGAVSGIAGIVFAIGQADLKRLLAYSSIENIGIIAMGVGLATLGRTYGRPDWILLGMGAALFHVWNHGLFKPLLFFSSGAIIHAAGTRDIDAMGGLGKRMPRTMTLFALGAVAICALPPLNGFASELLLYIGLFRTLNAEGGAAMAAAPAAAAMAMVGALAVATFVKLFGAVFLGSPRSPSGTDRAHDPPRSMILSMTAVAFLSAVFGLFPMIALVPIEAAAALWIGADLPADPISTLVPLRAVSFSGSALVALITLGLLIAKASSRSAVKGRTWDCGYAGSGSRMEYTASSFSRPIVELFKYLVHPRNPRISIRGAFPEKAAFESDVPDAVYERLVLPIAGIASRLAPRLAFLQRGQTNLYLLYLLVILIVLLIGGGVL